MDPFSMGLLDRGSAEEPPSKFQEILKAALPILATIYAIKNRTGPGPYFQGMIEGSQLRQQNEDRRLLNTQRQQDRETARQIQQQNADSMRLRAEAEQQRLQEIAAEKERIRLEKEKAAEESRRLMEVLRDSEAGRSGLLKDLFEQMGADSFSLAGIKDLAGILAQTNKPVPTEPLVQVDENGRPIYRTRTEAVGNPAYVKPEKPEKPEKGQTRAYTFKDEDEESPTYGQSFRITEDVHTGAEISRRPVSGAKTPPKPAPVTGGVKMKAPDGTIKTVPADSVDHYRKLGAVVVP